MVPAKRQQVRRPSDAMRLGWGGAWARAAALCLLLCAACTASQVNPRAGAPTTASPLSLSAPVASVIPAEGAITFTDQAPIGVSGRTRKDTRVLLEDSTTPMGTGDGLQRRFTGTYPRPALNGKVVFTSGAFLAVDDGEGKIIGDVDPAGANTVDYSTRVFDLTFKSAPAPGDTVQAPRVAQSSRDGDYSFAGVPLLAAEGRFVLDTGDRVGDLSDGANDRKIPVDGSVLPGALLTLTLTNTSTSLQTQADAQGRFSFGSVAFNEGPNEFTLTVTSNIAQPARLTYRFTLDTTPPVVEFTSITTGEAFGTNTISFNGQLDERDVTIAYRDPETGEDVSFVTTARQFQIPFFAFPDGYHSMEFTFTDEVGNATRKIVNFQVDTVAPPLAIVSPAAVRHPFTNILEAEVDNALAEIHGYTAAGAFVEAVLLSTGDTYSQVADSDGSFSIPPFRDIFGQILLYQSGAQDVRIVVTDAAGNHRDDRVSLTLPEAGQVPPPLWIENPREGSSISSAAYDPAQLALGLLSPPLDVTVHTGTAAPYAPVNLAFTGRRVTAPEGGARLLRCDPALAACPQTATRLCLPGTGYAELAAGELPTVNVLETLDDPSCNPGGPLPLGCRDLPGGLRGRVLHVSRVDPPSLSCGAGTTEVEIWNALSVPAPAPGDPTSLPAAWVRSEGVLCQDAFAVCPLGVDAITSITLGASGALDIAGAGDFLSAQDGFPVRVGDTITVQIGGVLGRRTATILQVVSPTRIVTDPLVSQSIAVAVGNFAFQVDRNIPFLVADTVSDSRGVVVDSPWLAYSLYAFGAACPNPPVCAPRFFRLQGVTAAVPAVQISELQTLSFAAGDGTLSTYLHPSFRIFTPFRGRIVLVRPADGSATSAMEVDVEGYVTGDSEIAVAQINGRAVAVDPAGHFLFRRLPLLAGGVSRIQAVASDSNGRVISAAVSVLQTGAAVAATDLKLDPPGEGPEMISSTFLVSGSISDNVDVVGRVLLAGQVGGAFVNACGASDVMLSAPGFDLNLVQPSLTNPPILYVVDGPSAGTSYRLIPSLLVPPSYQLDAPLCAPGARLLLLQRNLLLGDAAPLVPGVQGLCTTFPTPNPPCYIVNGQVTDNADRRLIHNFNVSIDFNAGLPITGDFFVEAPFAAFQDNSPGAVDVDTAGFLRRAQPPFLEPLSPVQFSGADGLFTYAAPGLPCPVNSNVACEAIFVSAGNDFAEDIAPVDVAGVNPWPQFEDTVVRAGELLAVGNGNRAIGTNELRYFRVVEDSCPCALYTAGVCASAPLCPAATAALGGVLQVQSVDRNLIPDGVQAVLSGPTETLHFTLYPRLVPVPTPAPTPVNGPAESNPPILVAATQTDILGFVSTNDAIATVNGILAGVFADGTFFVPALPLSRGLNPVDLVAYDFANQTQTQRMYVFSDPDPPAYQQLCIAFDTAQLLDNPADPCIQVAGVPAVPPARVTPFPSPENTALVSVKSADVEIRGVLSDGPGGSGVRAADFFLNGQSVTAYQQFTGVSDPFGADASPVTGSGLFRQLVTLQRGNNDFVLRARDRAGNLSKFHLILVLDLPPPRPPVVEVDCISDGRAIPGFQALTPATPADPSEPYCTHAPPRDPAFSDPGNPSTPIDLRSPPGDLVGFGDGVQLAFPPVGSVTLRSPPIAPGSLRITAPGPAGLLSVTDDGAGNLVGDGNGTIVYATGALVLNFTAGAPEPDAAVIARYNQPPGAPAAGSLPENRIVAGSKVTLTGRFLTEDGLQPALFLDNRSVLLGGEIVPSDTVAVGAANSTQITVSNLVGQLCRGGVVPLLHVGDTLVLSTTVAAQGVNSGLYTIASVANLCAAQQITLDRQLAVDAAGMVVQYEWAFSLTGIDAPNEGLNMLTLQAVDGNGNVTFTPVSFIRDTFPPAIVIQGVVGGFKTTNASPEVLFTDATLCTSGLVCPGGGFISNPIPGAGARSLSIRIDRLDENGEAAGDIGTPASVPAGSTLRYGWAQFSDDLSTLGVRDPVNVAYDLTNIDGQAPANPFDFQPAANYAVPFNYPDPNLAVDPNTGAPRPPALIGTTSGFTQVALGQTKASADPLVFSTPLLGDQSCADVFTGPPNPLPCRARRPLSYHVAAQAADRAGHDSVIAVSFDVVVTPEARLLSGAMGIISSNPVFIELLTDSTGLRMLLLDRLSASGVLYNQNLVLSDIIGDFDSPSAFAQELIDSDARQAFATTLGVLFGDPDGFGPASSSIAILLDVLRVLIDNGVLDDLLPVVDNPFILDTCTSSAPPPPVCLPADPGDGTRVFTFLSDILADRLDSAKTDVNADGNFFRTRPGPIKFLLPLQHRTLQYEASVRRRGANLDTTALATAQITLLPADNLGFRPLPLVPASVVNVQPGDLLKLTTGPCAGFTSEIATVIDNQNVTLVTPFPGGCGAAQAFEVLYPNGPALIPIVELLDTLEYNPALLSASNPLGDSGLFRGLAHQVEELFGSGGAFQGLGAADLDALFNALFQWGDDSSILSGREFALLLVDELANLVSPVATPNSPIRPTSARVETLLPMLDSILEGDLIQYDPTGAVAGNPCAIPAPATPPGTLRPNLKPGLRDIPCWPSVARGSAIDLTVGNAYAGATNLGLLQIGLEAIARPKSAGTAAGGTAGTIVLCPAPGPTCQVPAPAAAGAINGDHVTIWAGTGAGQTRAIADYAMPGRVATVDVPWGTPPDATSVYSVGGPLAEIFPVLRELVDDPDDFARGYSSAGVPMPPSSNVIRRPALEILSGPLANILRSSTFPNLLGALSDILNPVDPFLNEQGFNGDLVNYDENFAAEVPLPPAPPAIVTDPVAQNPPLLAALARLGSERMDTDQDGSLDSSPIRGLVEALRVLTTPVGLPGQGENFNPGYPGPVPDNAFVDTPICRETFFDGRTPLEIVVQVADGLLEPLPVGTNLFVADSGTAQAGGANTIMLAPAASAVDDFYKGYNVRITGGTGAGQIRIISDYVGATQTATVSQNWAAPPDVTSAYEVTSVNAVQDVFGRDRLTILLQGLADDPHVDESEQPAEIDDCANPCMDEAGAPRPPTLGDGAAVSRHTLEVLPEILNTVSRFGFKKDLLGGDELTSIFDAATCTPGACRVRNRLLPASGLLVDIGLPLDGPFRIGTGGGIIQFNQSLTLEAFTQLATFTDGTEAANYVLLLAARMAQDIKPLLDTTPVPPDANLAPAALRALADPDGDGDPLPDGVVDDLLPLAQVISRTGMAKQALDALRALRACGVNSSTGNSEIRGGATFEALQDATLAALPALSGAGAPLGPGDQACPSGGGHGNSNPGSALDDNPLFRLPAPQSSSPFGTLLGGSQGQGGAGSFADPYQDLRDRGVGPTAHLCIVTQFSPLLEECALILLQPAAGPGQPLAYSNNDLFAPGDGLGDDLDTALALCPVSAGGPTCSYRIRMMREPYNGCLHGDPINLGNSIGSSISTANQSNMDFLLRAIRFLGSKVPGFLLQAPAPLTQGARGRLPALLDVLLSPVPDGGGGGGAPAIVLQIAPAMQSALRQILDRYPAPLESPVEKALRLLGETVVDLGGALGAGQLPYDVYPTAEVLYPCGAPGPACPLAPYSGNGVNDALDMLLLGANSLLDQLESADGQNGVPEDPANPSGGDCLAVAPGCPTALSPLDPHVGYSDDPKVLLNFVAGRLPLWARDLSPGLQIFLESFDTVSRAGEFDPLYQSDTLTPFAFSSNNPVLDCRPFTARPCAGTAALAAALERTAYSGNCRPNPGAPEDLNCLAGPYVPAGGEAPRPAGSFGTVRAGVLDDGSLQLTLAGVDRLLNEWMVPPNDPANFPEGVLHRDRVLSQLAQLQNITGVTSDRTADGLFGFLRGVTEDTDLPVSGEGKILDSVVPIVIRLSNRRYAGLGAPASADAESPYDILFDVIFTLLEDPTDCDVDALGGAAGLQRQGLGLGADPLACQVAQIVAAFPPDVGLGPNALDAVFRDVGVKVERPLQPLLSAVLFDRLLTLFDEDPLVADLIELQMPFLGNLALGMVVDPASCATKPFGACAPRVLQNQPPPAQPFSIYDAQTILADALVADLQYLVPSSAAPGKSCPPPASPPFGPTFQSRSYAALCDPLVTDDLNRDGLVAGPTGQGLCGTSAAFVGAGCLPRIGNGIQSIADKFDESDNDPDGLGLNDVSLPLGPLATPGVQGDIGYTIQDGVPTIYGVDGVDEALLDGLADVIARDDPAYVVDHENEGPTPVRNRFSVRGPTPGVDPSAVELLDALGEMLLQTQLGP